MGVKMMSKSLIKALIITLAIFLCCTSIVKGQHKKVNEASHSATIGFFCGDDIYTAYNTICMGQIKKRQTRSLVIELKDAKRFLQKRSARINIVEECCNESCKVEEIKEYCP